MIVAIGQAAGGNRGRNLQIDERHAGARGEDIAVRPPERRAGEHRVAPFGHEPGDEGTQSFEPRCTVLVAQRHVMPHFCDVGGRMVGTRLKADSRS
jgi:hypothetical protein